MASRRGTIASELEVRNTEEPAIQVLLVDDDHRELVRLQQLLAEVGYVVSTATDAYQAIVVLRCRAIDLIVTDVDMPGMSGLELLGALETSHPELPAIVMTSIPTREGEEVASALGAVAYLRKPVQVPDLLEAVARALRRSDAR